MKKFGILGAVLMGAHVLFHVVECLVLPTVIVALSGHAVEEQAAAADGSVMVQEEVAEGEEAAHVGWSYAVSGGLVDFQESLRGLELSGVTEAEHGR